MSITYHESDTLKYSTYITITSKDSHINKPFLLSPNSKNMWSYAFSLIPPCIQNQFR